MNDLIDWQRFWCKSKNDIELDMNGFLPNPHADNLIPDTNIFDFDKINSIPCLVLLGEAGSGKSTTIECEFKKLIENNKDAILVYKNLNEYCDESRLINEIFQSEVITKWVQSDKQLILFLDSYDECLSEIKKLPQILKKQLKLFQLYSSRLHMRIICRSGSWNDSLHSFLIDFFNKDNVALYEIAPLRHVDISKAAKHYGINEKEFIQEVIKKEVQPFAINPLTLNFLISEYKNYQKISPTKEKIFYEGCRILCSEPNIDRQFISGKGNLSPEKRLALASRIAALMVFCNKPRVNIMQINSADSNTLTLEEILEGDEITENFTFSFTQQDIVETITQTSLFSTNGANCYSFYHWAYAEYLAAKFIVNHEFEVKQILSLITILSDDEGKIVEQVKGAATWLGIISKKLLEHSIKTDPMSLLNGDLASISNESKKEMVQSILDKLEATNITDSNWSLRFQYHKVNHPTLAEQLRPYIEDTTKGFLVRRVAIDIIEACELNQLNGALMEVALNKKDNSYIRKEAMHALSIVADDSSKLNLKPYAIESNDDDIDDELKGTALSATWPLITDTKEVFKALTPKKKRDLSGAYDFFINYKFSDNIEPIFLEDALNWIKKNPSSTEHLYDSFDNLKIKIIYLCWQNIASLTDKQLFAEIILQRMQNYISICPTPHSYTKKREPIVISNDVKKQLAKQIIILDSFEKCNQLHFLVENDLISLSDDFQFVLDSFLKESVSTIKSKWAYILSMFEYSSSERLDPLIDLIPKYAELKDVFSSWFESIEIGSVKATQMKQQYEEQKKWQQKINLNNQAKLQLKINVQERIFKDIKQYEQTKNSGWWVKLFMDMTLTDESTIYGDRLNSNINQFDSWNKTPDVLKEKIIELSKYFILENNDCQDQWFGQSRIHDIAFTGYKSLVLLEKCDSDFIANLGIDTWKKWVHIVIDYPESSGISGMDNAYLDVIKEAYFKVPDEVIDIVLKKIDIENARDDAYLFILNKIEHCIDDHMQKELYEKLKDNGLKNKSRSFIVELLLKNNNLDAIRFAKEIVNNTKNELCILVAVQLSKFCNNDDWKVIMNHINFDPEFGKEYFLLYATDYDMRAKPIWNRIDDIELAQLYIKLCEFFPKEEDPQFEGVHYVGAREELGQFRDGILNQLTNKGTPESIRAIEFINKSLTDTEVMFSLVKAKNIFRKNNWQPLSPQELLRLSINGKMRVILNQSDLLYFVMESLDRFEDRLQNENCLSFTLWNDANEKDPVSNKKFFTPKSEEELSDLIKDHLKMDIQKYGISTFREVQLRRPNYIQGGKQGENTDILISYFNQFSNTEFNVIIEVKGSWNEKVHQNLNNQLADRYLDTAKLSHGLYLIGWYDCDAYKDKKNNTQASSIENAGVIYSKQATELLSSGKTIKAYILDCRLRN